MKGGEAEDMDNFLGPWAKYADEKDGAKPSEVSSVCRKPRSACHRFNSLKNTLMHKTTTENIFS